MLHIGYNDTKTTTASLDQRLDSLRSNLTDIATQISPPRTASVRPAAKSVLISAPEPKPPTATPMPTTQPVQNSAVESSSDQTYMADLAMLCLKGDIYQVLFDRKFLGEAQDLHPQKLSPVAEKFVGDLVRQVSTVQAQTNSLTLQEKEDLFAATEHASAAIKKLNAAKDLALQQRESEMFSAADGVISQLVARGFEAAEQFQENSKLTDCNLRSISSMYKDLDFSSQVNKYLLGKESLLVQHKSASNKITNSLEEHSQTKALETQRKLDTIVQEACQSIRKKTLQFSGFKSDLEAASAVKQLYHKLVERCTEQ